MNLLHPKEQAGYVVTGVWSHIAFSEAQNLKKHIVLPAVKKMPIKLFPVSKTGNSMKILLMFIILPMKRLMAFSFIMFLKLKEFL